MDDDGRGGEVASAGPFDVVVIGGGPAGVTAALRAAELGARTAVVERDRLGGTCTDDGCAPTRVLAKAARLVRDAQASAAFGVSAERAAVDLRAALASAQRIIYGLHQKKQLRAHLEAVGTVVLEQTGDARFVDSHTLVLADGRQVRGERFVIASGGHPRRLAVPGSELASTYADIWSLQSLPRRLAVVGGAATGAQLASIFNAFGARVSLIEVAARILPEEDADVSAAMQRALEERGIEVISGVAGIERIERREAQPRELGLVYRSGEVEHTLAVNAVIMAVGWPGNLESLSLEAAGVGTERGYIAVDDTLRTEQPHIWAAGDVTGRMKLVQSATYEGRVAAENAVLGADRRVQHTVVAHGGFTDPEYASVGLSEARADLSAEPIAIGVVPFADLDRAVIDRRTEGFCKLIANRDSRRVLGAHVVGEQAVEVVQIAAAAMAADMPVDRLAEVEFAYPTFTSIVGLAARQIVHQLRLPAGEQEAWQALGRQRVAEWERREPAQTTTQRAEDR